MKVSASIVVCLVLQATLLLPGRMARAATPDIEWDAAGPQTRMGPRWPNQPAFTYVFAPKAVAQAVRQTLGGNPDSWNSVGRIQNYVREDSRSKEKHEVVYFRRGGRCFVCLVQRDRWKRLDTPQSLPYISEIMGATLKLPNDQDDNIRLSEFVQDVASLYEPKTGKDVLVEGNRQMPEEYTRDVDRPPKDAADFRSLCVNPVATRHHDVWVITANAVTISEGAVERWTLTLRAGNRVELADIEFRQIRPPGSFYCDRY